MSSALEEVEVGLLVVEGMREEENAGGAER